MGGAVAGGAGGHFAGNKFGNHGTLGTLGGALAGGIAGSMMQDHFKHEKEEPQSRYGGVPGLPAPPGVRMG